MYLLFYTEHNFTYFNTEFVTTLYCIEVQLGKYDPKCCGVKPDLISRLENRLKSLSKWKHKPTVADIKRAAVKKFKNKHVIDRQNTKKRFWNYMYMITEKSEKITEKIKRDFYPHFNVGEKVYVVLPSTTNKIYGVIYEKCCSNKTRVAILTDDCQILKGVKLERVRKC